VPHFSFEIDPHQVLGVASDAPLDKIRDAYRQKAKRYHPDSGGEEWAFRILNQAYEMLCSARVVRATRIETPQRPPRSAPAKPERVAETVHQGIHDRNVPAAKIVGVEHLCVRYQWDDVNYLWLTQRAPDEERFLSCCINLTWPDPALADKAAPVSDRSAIIAAVSEAFDQTIIGTRVVLSRSRVEDDRFAGWLSYPNFDRSWKAVTTLHENLRHRGLGMRQWSRDLFVPRQWS
jgi:hypothetical protein